MSKESLEKHGVTIEGCFIISDGMAFDMHVIEEIQTALHDADAFYPAHISVSIRVNERLAHLTSISTKGWPDEKIIEVKNKLPIWIAQSVSDCRIRYHESKI